MLARSHLSSIPVNTYQPPCSWVGLVTASGVKYEQICHCQAEGVKSTVAVPLFPIVVSQELQGPNALATVATYMNHLCQLWSQTKGAEWTGPHCLHEPCSPHCLHEPCLVSWQLSMQPDLAYPNYREAVLFTPAGSKLQKETLKPRKPKRLAQDLAVSEHGAEFWIPAFHLLVTEEVQQSD